MARRQHGYVTRAQLLAVGVGSRVIDGRLRNGGLIRVHHGVYAVGYIPEGPIPRAMAAVLACGPLAVLSHHSAAALWGFRPWRSGRIEVTAPSLHRRRGIKAHRSTTLTPRDTTKHQGIPVTKPARTLCDIAPALPARQLIRAVNDALISGCLRDHALEGTRLEGYVNDLSRSPLEDDYKPWNKRYGLPEPLYNVKLGRYEVDVYYPAAKVIVELDGWHFHRTKKAFEDDRERDAYMLAHGIVTIRITRDRMKNAPAREAARLRSILDSRGTLTDL